MVLHCALAACLLPSYKQSSHAPQELIARKVLNLSTGYYGDPSKGPFGTQTFRKRVDGVVGITEYDFGNASAYFDSKSGRFQFLVNSYVRPSGEKQALSEDESLRLVVRAYKSLNIGFELKDVISQLDPGKNAIRFKGHQYYQGTRVEDANFSARVSASDGCLEILNVGKLVEPPSEAISQRRQEGEVVYAAAVEIASKTGEQKLEILQKPELVISNPDVLSRGSLFKLKGNFADLSVIENSSSNRSSGFYSFVSSYRPMDQGAVYQVRVDPRTLKLVSMVNFGVGNTNNKLGNTAPSSFLRSWDEVLIGSKKARAVGGLLTLEPEPKIWHEGIPVLLRSRSRLLLVAFDRKSNSIRFKVGKENKIAAPNGPLLKALRIVSAKPTGGLLGS